MLIRPNFSLRYNALFKGTLALKMPNPCWRQGKFLKISRKPTIFMMKFLVALFPKIPAANKLSYHHRFIEKKQQYYWKNKTSRYLFSAKIFGNSATYCKKKGDLPYNHTQKNVTCFFRELIFIFNYLKLNNIPVVSNNFKKVFNML